MEVESDGKFPTRAKACKCPIVIYQGLHTPPSNIQDPSPNLSAKPAPRDARNRARSPWHEGEDAAVARQRFDQLCQDRRNQVAPWRLSSSAGSAVHGEPFGVD